MKIVYCINSVNTHGGIEMITLVKANALAAIPGYKVYIVVTDNAGNPMIPLSESVSLIDLKINYYEDDWKSRWRVLYLFFVKRMLHKKRLAKVLNEIKPDIVVSVGLSEKNMVAQINGDWKTIREFHFARTYRHDAAKSVFERLMAYGGNIIDSFTLRKYNRIVVLTEEDKMLNWSGINNVMVIPNPLTLKAEGISSLNVKRVMALGRLTMQKNFSSLIRVFRIVADRYPDWTLDIYGDGSEHSKLSSEIHELGLDGTVTLKGYTSQPLSHLCESSIFVSSSIFEGFALVLVEAMSCGLPVVSYACHCGPRDMITDGKDGFLVPVNDERMMVEKICYLIEHEDVRRQMGHAALEKAKQYSQEKIMAKWQELFETLVKE